MQFGKYKKREKKINKYTILYIMLVCVYWTVGTNKSIANDDTALLCFAMYSWNEPFVIIVLFVLCAISQEIT